MNECLLQARFESADGKTQSFGKVPPICNAGCTELRKVRDAVLKDCGIGDIERSV